MINQNINYIKIEEIISRVKDHPMLANLNIEQTIRYVLEFISKFGFNSMYQDKKIELKIQDYRTVLPCDLIRIIQIKDKKTNLCYRQMTSDYIPNDKLHDNDFSYKTQGKILYASRKEGDIVMAYKSIPVDDNGFPLLIDNDLYLLTLELYIKCKMFTILFDQGKINQNVLQHTEQQYAFNAGQLQSEINIPSVAEMESIKNMWTDMLQYSNRFTRDFSYGGYNRLKVQ